MSNSSLLVRACALAVMAHLLVAAHNALAIDIIGRYGAALSS